MAIQTGRLEEQPLFRSSAFLNIVTLHMRQYNQLLFTYLEWREKKNSKSGVRKQHKKPWEIVVSPFFFLSFSLSFFASTNNTRHNNIHNWYTERIRFIHVIITWESWRNAVSDNTENCLAVTDLPGSCPSQTGSSAFMTCRFRYGLRLGAGTVRRRFSEFLGSTDDLWWMQVANVGTTAMRHQYWAPHE
jgi:hypothetical protein